MDPCGRMGELRHGHGEQDRMIQDGKREERGMGRPPRSKTSEHGRTPQFFRFPGGVWYETVHFLGVPQ